MNLLSEMLYPTPFVVSPLLPILLISLSRDKHSPDTTSHVLDEYDYVIVGAGSAGSVLASRLSEMSCFSVLLLEAGKPPPILTDVPSIARSFVNTDVDWRYKTAPQKHTGALHKNRQIAWPSGKMIGGSSGLNGMFAVRGNRKNYDDWAAMGATGWSYEEVLPYFIKMEDNRNPEFSQNGFHGVGGPQTLERPPYSALMKHALMEAAKMMGYQFVDPNGPTQTGFYDFQGTIRNGQRCSVAKAYLVPADNRTNLHILPNAFVRKVLIVNRRAIGIEFDFKGITYLVKARREVILSAGATNSAQLLMLSGIGPRKELQKFNIPVIADLPVGYNLQDHQGPIVPFTLGSEIKPIMIRLLDQRNVLQYIKHRTGVLGASEGCSLIAFLESGTVHPKTDFPDHEIYFIESPPIILKTQLNLRAGAFKKIFGPYVKKPIYICVPHVLNPKSIGRVYLQSANPYDPPIIDPNYYDHPQDLEDVLQGMKTCIRMSKSPAAKKIGVKMFETVIPGCEDYVKHEDDYLRCLARSVAITLNHQVGTAKMGDPDDPTTVVDPELRVKTIQGLRVVDASVMPLVPTGNTHLPTMMIAEKAVDMIKSSLKCSHIYKGQEGYLPYQSTLFSTGFKFNEPNVNKFSHQNYDDSFSISDVSDKLSFSDEDFRSHSSGAAEDEAPRLSYLNQDYVNFLNKDEKHNIDEEIPGFEPEMITSSSNVNEIANLNVNYFPNVSARELRHLSHKQYKILLELGLKNFTHRIY